jgi:hypothetical protein
MAAEYCVVSANTLGRHVPMSTKISDRTIYDRRVLDRSLDERAGLISASNGVGLPIVTSDETLLKAPSGSTPQSIGSGPPSWLGWKRPPGCA